MVLTWTAGSRAVEITAFADGELAIDAQEHGESVESFPEADVEQRLKWLIASPGTPAAYAAIR